MTATSRRRFLQQLLAGATFPFLLDFSRKQLSAKLQNKRPSGLTVTKVERVTVEVPFREVPARNMAREIPHWVYSELCTVHLSGDVAGTGETLLYYTWGVTSDDDVQRVQGKNALELMWDDSLGAGLQMALFDAVAKWGGVPVHQLLGLQIYEKTPVSWWNIDTSAADMVSECQEALKQGYTSYKTKGRPWYDVWEQCEAVSKALPESFHLDMDFNATLLDAKRGIPILKDLEQFPQVDIYESPIPQEDLEGNREICAATKVPVAFHYGRPDPLEAIRVGACDGFLIGHGATELMKAAGVLELARKPFWLQLVGTGVTAAWSLHFGAVQQQAVWPAVNCHQLYQHSLLKQPIVVKDGNAAIPTAPGLGHEIDWQKVEEYRVEKPKSRPVPPRLLRTTWPDGRVMYLASTDEVNFMLNLGMAGKLPYFERGVQTDLHPDDGSGRWQELYREAQKGPVFRKE